MHKVNPQSIAGSDPFAFLRALSSVLIFRLAICSCVLAALLCLSASAQTNLPSVTKVEPPSWWARHSINPVRLLVRGKNLNGARVRSTSPVTQTSEVLVNRSGTYVFVNVTISPGARPGSYPLKLITPQGSATIPFTIEPPLAANTHFQGINRNDVIYLIMPDRFADGDQSNNAPADAPAAANDRKNPRAYHGGDLRGIINHLGYLKDLGVTALWLNPWYDNWNGVNTCDKPWCPNTYYHGYHAIDYYAVEDRFGDLATLRELIEKAHALGLKVIQDQVANHVGSRHPWVSDPPLDNWFHGTQAKHSLNRFQNSVLLSPHANSIEFRNTLDGWFSEDLPDMNQEEPEVARYEIQNALWWVGIAGIDGIRQDTIQYMPRKFIRELSDALHRQYPKLWMVGEVFDHDAAHTSFFIGGHQGWDGLDTHLDSVFDFPLWNASLLAFTNKAPMRALRDRLKYDALYPDAARVTTFANNHDTKRFMSLDDATLEGAMMHVAFTLSVRGIPQLYCGEEIAMEGKDDPDNRRDFPGGFPDDTRNAFQPNGRTRDETRMWQWTRDWIRLRRDHSALRDGQLIDLYYDDDAYVFARLNKSETVIIAMNRAKKEKQVSIPASALGLKDGTGLTPLIATASGSPVAKGNATISVPPKSAVAYIAR
ncbi:MAG TPA: alpha-amylase family glycosyl hydrolase [Pyrinomonadaceae bacterium]|nr:alpha-amylase family glycosyl hydrolase [Pyrinomonadaceae bacterium]